MFSRNVSCISITKQSHNYNFVQHFPNQVLVAPHPLIIFKHNQLIIERIIKWFLRLSKLLMMIFCESATTRLICTSIARQIFIYKCVIRLFIIHVFASYMSYVYEYYIYFCFLWINKTSLLLYLGNLLMVFYSQVPFCYSVKNILY